MTQKVMKDFLHSTCRIDTSGLIYKNKNKAANEISLKAIENKFGRSYSHTSNSMTMTTTLHQNVPTSGIEIIYNPCHIMFMGYMHWILKDPRGFSVYVYPSIIGYILDNCTVINGVIQEELLYHIPYKYVDLEVLLNKQGQWTDRYNGVWLT